MNQATIANISQHSIKTQIIKQIRELDWSREYHRVSVLMLLNNLEVACLARASETENEKLIALKAYNLQVYNNFQTEIKFKQLINMYAELSPSYRAIENFKLLSGTTDVKTFDEELEGNDFDGNFDLDDADYNPTAAAYNDKVDVERALDELATITNKMSLDWVANTVAPTPSVEPKKPFVEPVKPVLVSQPLTSKPATQRVANLTRLEKAALLGLIFVSVLAAVALAIVAPPVILAATMTAGVSTALAGSVTATFCFGISLAAGAVLGMLIDYAKNKLLRRSNHAKVLASAVAIEASVAESTVAISTVPKAKPAPQNDNIHIDPVSDSVSEITASVNDNIHLDTVLEDAIALETPLAPRLSTSKHSLFHAKKENPVEPKQILVRNISSRR